MEKKLEINTSNIILILGWLSLLLYGLYYNSVNNILIIAVTVLFILFRCVQLRQIRFDITFVFLMEAFLIKAILDLHIGKDAIVPTTMAIPMLLYLYGKLLVANTSCNIDDGAQELRANISMLFLGIGVSVLGIINFWLTRKSPIKSMGYYSVAFTNDKFYTDAFTYYFNFIFVLAYLIAAIMFLFYKFSNNSRFIKIIRVLLIAIVVVIISIFAYKYTTTERFAALKQGISLIVEKPWGNFGLELTYNNSTCNMWLDYGRDYGVLVFGPLLVFQILTFINLVKLTLNKNIGIFTKTLFLVVFCGINIYYFTDPFAYANPQYWYIGLVIYGMVSELGDCRCQNVSEPDSLKRISTRNNHRLLDALFENCLFDNLIFSIFCATVFTMGMCHWILDVEYRNNVSDIALAGIDFRFFFFSSINIIIYYLIKNIPVKLDFTTLILCQIFILISVLDYHNESYGLVAYAWMLPMTFIAGKVVAGKNIKLATYRIEKLYFVMAIGIFITALLDFSMNFKYAPVYGFQLDKWPSFWLGGMWENRCTYELGFVLVTSATGYLIYSIKRNKLCIPFVLISNIIIQKLVISVTGRENRLLLPISVAIFVVLYLLDNWKKMSIQQKGIVYVFIILVVAGTVLAIIAFFNNWGGLYDKYLASNWSSTGGVFTNIRFSYDWDGFKAMLAHPLEDYVALYDIRNPHSMLLEYGRAFGLSIWMLLVIFRLLLIKDAIALITNKAPYAWIKYLLIPSFCGLNLYYSMELNGFAHRYLWMIGLFISGMIRGWLECSEMQLYSQRVGGYGFGEKKKLL